MKNKHIKSFNELNENKNSLEELTDEDIVELYKAIDNFINFLDKELVGDDNAK